jgi:hypothetical protein
LPLLCEYEAVLDTTAAFEDVWVLGIVVAFANNVCRAELEFFGERGSACPLYRVLVIVGATVFTAHDFGFV